MAQQVFRYREKVEFQLEDPQGSDTYFVLGVRKSGSSVFNAIVQSLAKMNQIPFVDVAGRLFDAGILVRDWKLDPDLTKLLRPGYVFGGFRDCPLCFVGQKLFESGRKILLVRDPRDALVSEYFSNAFSHSIPVAGDSKELMQAYRRKAQSTELDRYVTDMAVHMRQTLREYLPLRQDRRCRIFRYEDVIFDKTRWISEICDFFGWAIAPTQIEAILGWADVVPEKEDSMKFIRRVTPGDHQDKLSSATISWLTEMLREEMADFGYSA